MLQPGDLVSLPAKPWADVQFVVKVSKKDLSANTLPYADCQSLPSTPTPYVAFAHHKGKHNYLVSVMAKANPA
jgi:hypothetical protein